MFRGTDEGCANLGEAADGDGGRIPGAAAVTGDCPHAADAPAPADGREFLGVGAPEDEAGVGTETGLETAMAVETGDGVAFEAVADVGVGVGGGRMNGWLKKTSNSSLSLGFRFSRPLRRSSK